jgi:large subunit ribosomal protein L32
MAKHPVPKKRTSAAKRNSRRSHHALTAPTLAPCSTCSAMKQPHVVCPTCGSYKGRQILIVD